MQDHKRALDRLIRLGVLETIQKNADGLSSRDVAERLEDDVKEQSPQIRNVCAKLPVQTADRLDAAVEHLGCQKRSFIEAAILAALDRFDEIAEEEGLDESYGWYSTFQLEDTSDA